MNNNTDITYSFNLDNYINSLESNRPFNDYKILVNNKDYNTLSLEHNRLMNEVNTMINSDMYSTEGIMNNISKFISWFKDMINRLITMISTFIKRIIAKIYELTMRSKNNIWSKYKDSKFTAGNIKIKDYRLKRRSDMMDTIDDFMDAWEIWDSCISEEPDLEQSIDAMTELDNLLDEMIPSEERNSPKASSYINGYCFKMFYESNEKVEMTIQDFFDCKTGETPSQIELLSDDYKHYLLQFKKNNEQFLRKLKSLQKTYLNFFSEKSKEISDIYEEPEAVVEKCKKLLKNITLLHNINYTFFITVARLRNKIAKYILKASLGGILDKLDSENKESQKTKNGYYYYRELPSGSSQADFKKNNGKLEVDSRGALHFIKYKANEKMSPNDNEFTEAWFGLYNKLKSLNCLSDFRNRAGRLMHQFKGDKMGGKPISFKNEITRLIESLWTIEKTIPLPFENLLLREFDIDPDYGVNFSILYGTRCIEFDKDKDILYHTSDVALNALNGSGMTKEGFIYSEPRIYVGVNEIYDRIGGSPISVNDKKALKSLLKNTYVYKLIIPQNITVYSDPEIGGMAGYIIANNVQVENMTNELIEYIDSEN